MPASRSHLTRVKPRQAVIDLGEGDVVNVVFNTNAITPAWMRDAKVRDESADPESLPKALAEVILSWDVSEDDGSEFKPLAENIAVFSYPVQSALLEAILKATVPASEEGNASSEPLSSPPATSSEPAATPLNGAVASPSLAPSASPSPT